MEAPTASRGGKLSEHSFHQLRDIVRERTGIEFTPEKRYLLESRVRPRLAACGVQGFEAYVRYLRQNDDTQEITRLINAVTINETSFFRHPAQFDALDERILPEVIRKRSETGAAKVNLWSAACSTGDEPYSLAIIMRERLRPRFPQTNFEIVGTDIDTDALRGARAARYRPRAVRNVPTAYLHKYFRRSDDTYILRSSIRDMVTFRSLNLVDRRDMSRMRGFDIVMCSNVLIYFADIEKTQVLRSLHRALRPGGYLLVGGSETLGDRDVPFVPVQDVGALVYRRVPEAD